MQGRTNRKGSRKCINGYRTRWSILGSKQRMSSNAQVGMPESRSTGEDVEPDLKLRSLWAWVHLCSDYNSAVRANCACSMDDAALLADSLQYEANMAETRAVLVEELKRCRGGGEGWWNLREGFESILATPGLSLRIFLIQYEFFNPSRSPYTPLNIWIYKEKKNNEFSFYTHICMKKKIKK